jgi:hypothetical protein
VGYERKEGDELGKVHGERSAFRNNNNYEKQCPDDNLLIAEANKESGYGIDPELERVDNHGRGKEFGKFVCNVRFCCGTIRSKGV